MLRHLPNALTLGNLFCGCCALVFIFNGRIYEAAALLFGCFALDYADGLAARVLGATSALGKELDSLADVVSFGAVPGALFYHLISKETCTPAYMVFPPASVLPEICFPALAGFILTAFAALRLGRFNLDERQKYYFLGLTTPATALFVLGIALAGETNRFGIQAVLNLPVLYGLIALLSLLMNAELPLFGLKFGGPYSWRPFVFLALFIVMVFPLRELALSAVVLCYVLASVFLPSSVLED